MIRDRWHAARRWIGEDRRRVAVLGATAVVLLGVMGFMLGMPGRLEPDGLRPTASVPIGLATGTPAPSSTPIGEWEPLELPPYEPVADLMPDADETEAVSPEGSFTLRSLTSVPAVELAAGLVAYPPVELVVSPGPSADLAIVRPAETLAEGARYRFDLRDATGTMTASWVFRTEGALHVVRLLPDDRTTQVPLDTAIEIEFDRDGVTDIGSHFSIEPPAPGEFESHGRTWAFVPSAPLQAATLYTVTLTSGVGIDGSDSVLETDLRFAFETAGGQDADSGTGVFLSRPVHEVRPNEAPVLPVQVWGLDEDQERLTQTVDVYQLATLDDALSAAARLSVDRGWARWSSTGNVPTDGLVKSASLEGVISIDRAAQSLSLPTGLAEGWYLIDLPQEGRHAQALLQVTDLTIYALASPTRTIVWVNDLADGAPVRGARVAFGASGLGQTGADGLLDVSTPPALLDVGEGTAQLLVIADPDGRRLIAPVGQDVYWRDAAQERWWLLFGTDRLEYRRDDTIHAWGLVRSRTDRSVPADIELRLVPGRDNRGPALARAAVPATSRGVLAGELTFRGLPLGEYSVALFVDGQPVSQATIRVAEIRKPAFRIDLTTDRRAYLAGDTVAASAVTTFFDGTSAPGLALRMTASGGPSEVEEVVATDASGAAAISFRAIAQGASMGTGYVHAMPDRPEEGASSGSTSFAVLPASVWLKTEGSIADGFLRVEGLVSHVDFARAEEQMLTSGWVEDPGGGPASSRQVTIDIDHVTWKPVQTGTTYDYLLKRVVPIFEYERSVRSLGNFDSISNEDGAFSLTVPTVTGDGAYEISAITSDAAGRQMRRDVWVSSSPVQAGPQPVNFPYLEERGACGVFGIMRTAALSETVSLTLREGDGSVSQEGPTLFLVGHIGIQDTVVTDESVLQRVFDDSDLPSVTVRAVRLTSAGLIVTNDVHVRVDPADKALDVSIELGRATYAPGEEASVTITTRGPDGRPLPADVIVRVVDMKLYAIGAVEDISADPLMSPVSSGFLGSYAAHLVTPPRNWWDGCGASSGGGDEREDFADLASFQLITTDARGRGIASFTLPDDLTSWAVSGTALAAGLESGDAMVELPATLPFFVDATVAAEYLQGEQPVIQVRAYGEGLQAGDAVRFTVEAEGLGLAETVVDGRAFEPVRVPLPALELGRHELRIAAESLDTADELRDAVVRRLTVVPTRLQTLMTSSIPLRGGTQLPGGEGLTTYVFADAGRGALLDVLQQLAWNPSARFDAALAADEAGALLEQAFGVEQLSLPPSGYEQARAGWTGLSLLPYASPDLYLTARVALVAAGRLPDGQLAVPLRDWADQPDATRERRIVALAGLAGLGQDVLRELREFEVDGLATNERLWLAIGLAAAGDRDAARSIQRAVLTEYGSRLGDWVRITDQDQARAFDATVLALLLSANLGDPIAADLSRYVMHNPSSEQLAALEQLGYVRAGLEWMPRDTARFAWAIGGERQEVTIEPGRAHVLVLTAEQRQTLSLELLEGEAVIAAAWSGPASYEALPASPLVSIKRTVTPAAEASAQGLVRVVIDVQFDPDAPPGCYQVTDLLPSGLAPVTLPWDGFSGDRSQNLVQPYEVEGQRVSWCLDPERDPVPLGYAARVVTAGTYRWEPAVVEYVREPSVGAATPVATYTIR